MSSLGLGTPEKPKPSLTAPFNDFLDPFNPNKKPLERVKDDVTLELTEHTYLPKAQDPLEDWVACVAAPALRAFDKENPGRVKTFATVGTGAGLDALAAIEILNPRTVMMTDLHPDVVKTAIKNVRNNMRKPSDKNSLHIVAGRGGLMDPLIVNEERKYDLVYENLPNIPLPELHSKLLEQSKNFLNPEGRILSSIGGRIPLQAMLDMANEAGCESRILTYTWKIQSEAEEVIRGYADWEKQGKGPFYFYPREKVEAIFSRYSSPAAAAKDAFKIEKELEQHRITATNALAGIGNGSFAHTVAVIESHPVER